MPRAAKLIGWAVVVIGLYIVVAQVRYMVQKKTGLPDVRHPVLWSKNLYQQARRNRNQAIAAELASFYLIERQLKDADLIVEPALEVYRWDLEHVSRTRVTVSSEISPIPPDAWKDLKTPHSGTLNKRKLYILVEPDAKTYVFVSTIGEADPLYIVPENVYRSRVVDKSGANLRAP